MRILILLFLFVSSCYADQDLISLFPIENYDQHVSHFINSNADDYDKTLLNTDVQQKHVDLFYEHYFGSLSPWSAEYVAQVATQATQNNIYIIEQKIIAHFSNTNKSADDIGYGENFRPYTKNWIENIANNIKLNQLSQITYHANQRGIAIDNLPARALPTYDVHFYNHRVAGQGYPFDNLQMSALWAGTPVYILAETNDHAWVMVLTPDFIAWVKSNGIARVNEAFVKTWIAAARKSLLAITQTATSVSDKQGHYLFSAYVGSVFPGTKSEDHFQLFVPVMDADQHAVIKQSIVGHDKAAVIPISATPHHFSTLMQTLIARPYGWGGMYFYNDCSAELKSLFTPFGIWLPRHSSYQVTVGKMVDMSGETQEKRLAYLLENGRRFLTIIYIGGHVMLYVGKPSNIAMTYQNIWGLTPKPSTRRAVIGQSVLMPLLLSYPEDSSLVSLVNKKYFQISYLDQMASSDMLKLATPIDVQALMFPEGV